MKKLYLILALLVGANVIVALGNQSEVEISILSEQGGEPAVDIDPECISGGPGSTSCSLNWNGLICDVSCNGKHYACCGQKVVVVKNIPL